MSYDVEAAKAAGHSEEDIANHLAQTHGFDVLGARKEGYSNADIINHLAPMEVQPEAKQPSNIALPAELGLLGGAGATAYQVGDIGLKGSRNVVRKVEQILENLKKPETISASAPSEFAGPKTPVDKYGKAMHGGVYSTTQDMSKMYKAGEEAQAFKAANPAWEVRQGSSIALPPDLKAAAAAAKTVPATTGLLGKAQQIAEPVISGVKSLGTPLKFAGKLLAPIAGAFEAGTQGGEAWNRGETGDTTGAAISGLGSLGSAAMMSGNPFIAIPGAAVSLAAPQINKYRDLVKQGRIKHEAPNYENIDAMGNAYAQGGVVHLADGGLSETGPFIGYPHIKNKPNDPNFVQQSGPILGGLDAILGVGKRDDVSMLTPEGQAYHEAYDKYEPAGIAANVLPFMGGPTKAVGKAAMRELGPKAAGMAENYLTKIGGIQYALPPGDKSADVAKKVKGFLEHTPTKPNPLVGTRYKTTDLGGLIEPTPFDIEKAIGAKAIHRPYDLSSRNQLVEEVSGHKLINPVLTEGGQGFGRDVKLQATGQGGASNKIINDRILKRVDKAAQEGNGQVFNIPSSMGYGSEAFSTMPIDILLDLIKQREFSPETMQYLNNLVRAKSPKLQNFVGFEHPEVGKQFTEGGFGLATTPGKLRIGATEALMGKQSGAQSLLDYNQEDLFHAIRAPELRNVPPGYMGETVMEAVPGHPGFTTGSHGAYDSGDASKYVGQGVNAPISLWMPDTYKQALAEVRSNPKTAEKALGHQRAMARNVLGTAEEGVAQTITPQVADNLQRYQEAVKSGALDPNDLDAIHKYIYGAKAEHYAPGGKVLSAIKKMSEEAQAAYKAKFTPGFYHGSPSPNIKAFDPAKGTKPEEWKTPGVTFVTRDSDFAESFLPGSKNNNFKTGATMYPVNVNLGKHWHPNTDEGKATIQNYLDTTTREYPSKGLLNRGDWTEVEHPTFLDHLRNEGYDTFHVVEGGTPNVGVFEPQNIRGKFAKFNPEDAESSDFMKAAGGPVEHHAPGGRVGMLNELMQLIKQQGGAAAAKRLERAADLVPNLENKFQPQALKSAFTGDNATAVMVMKPSQFDKYATPLPETHKNWDQFNIEDLGKKGNYQDYLDYLGRVSQQGGFSSVPYLQLNKEKGDIFPAITGHEGRNRSDALAKLGDQSSLVQMLPRAGLREQFPRRSQEEYLNALRGEIGTDPMITVQPDWDPIKEKWINRGLRDLPELFASGGLVFNPQGEDYDYQTALAHGMGPDGTGDNQGHWGSVAPVSDDEQQLHDLPSDSYVVLKGKSHPTFHKAEAAEQERGSEIVKKGDRYYSVPKK